MSQKLEAFLERLKKTDTLDDLQRTIEHIRDVYDVEHVIYHSVSGTGKQYGALTYDPVWVDRYLEQDYTRLDPVVLGALRQFHPMDWKRLDWSHPISRKFLNEAIDSGVGNQGYSIPIRGPNGQFALFTINKNSNDDNWRKFTNQYARDFLLLSHYLHQRANHIHKSDEAIKMRDLSPRERDSLIYLGLGYARGHIAEKMQISEHTLRVYIDSARYKLGAANTTHAVAQAISRGVIVL